MCVNVPQRNVKIGVVLGEDSAQKCGHTSNKHIPKMFLCQSTGYVIKGFDLIDSFWSVFLIRALGESFWYYTKQDKKKNSWVQPNTSVLKTEL